VLAGLLLAMIASMLIGLSLPITATYIMTVVMVAPALVKLGIPMHVAHMLAFYFAVLSEVSPPVGLSPCAAAAVTGGNPFGSMMQAWKYSLPAFLVPFYFSTTTVGYSLLIVGGNWPDFLLATMTSVCSLFFVCLGIVAVAMVIAPIGWSIPGLAPLLAGTLMVLHHLRVTRGGTGKGEATV
jgi:TRAP-type uncharacterized transport system fused permease subunit